MTQVRQPVASLESLALALNGKRAGNGWIACCPAHADRTPSLSLTEEDGLLLVHCHAGCSQEAVIEELKARGLWPESEGNMNSRSDQIDAIYPYVDEAGSVLYEKVRSIGKHFFLHRPKAGGGFVNGLGDVRRVLYRLPKIIAAIPVGKPIIITEGEKDAETVEKLGFVATTNFEGAGKWREEYSQSLKGARCFICGDLDEPGKKHVRLVANKLLSTGLPAKIIDLPAELNGQEVKDISDWVAAGGTRENFIRLAKEAKEWANESSEHADVMPLPLDIFLGRPIQPRAKLIGTWLTERMPFMVAGQAGCGKSLFVYSLAYAIASGTDFLGWRAERPFKVGILDGEMFDATIQSRLSGIIRGVGKEDVDPTNLRILSRDLFSEKELPFVDLREPNDRKRILNMFEGVNLLILDNINSLFSGGNESATEFWIDMEKLLFEARQLGMAVCVVHHTTKTGIKSPAGSSKNVRLVESAVLLEKICQADSNLAYFNLSFAKNRELTSDTEPRSARMTTENGVSRWQVGPAIQTESEREWVEPARRMQAAGDSYRQIAGRLGVSKSTVERELNKCPAVPECNVWDTGTVE